MARKGEWTVKSIWYKCLLLLVVTAISCAGAEANPFEGSEHDVGFVTGETATAAPEAGAVPAATPSPTAASDTQNPGQSGTSDTPSRATYRYLTGTPSSGVPLYYTSTGSKINTRLSRGTLVLVHEYANGRARITFGGWKGWVAVSSLSEKDPGSGQRVGYRYAYDDSGSVPLYRYGFEYAIAYIPSGAKVAVTDMKEPGYTYVMHGAVSGWAKNSSLRSKLPEGVSGQEGSDYYYRKLVGDKPGQPVQLYNDSSCGSWGMCGTLPEGTVVKVLSTQLNVRISYGGTEYYVKPANIFREISGQGGSSADTGITAPIEDPDPPTPSQDGGNDDHGTSSSGTPARSSSSGKTSQTKQRVSVEVKYLGLTQSCIVDGGGERLVATAELEFDTEAPAGKRIAYIYAPKTGKCSMWKKASKKSDLVKKCKAGTVVMVIQYGREFSKILYDGKEGYVLTSCLKFAGADIPTPGTGVISYGGRATGSTTVNIRGAGNSSAHRIAEWRTGTEVLVFSHKNGWYEVECRGIHGWVHEKYLTLTE